MTTAKTYFVWSLVVVCLLGAAVRFALAPHRELEVRFDTLLFQTWGWDAYEHGLTNIYNLPTTYPASIQTEVQTWQLSSQRQVNYLPPYLYVLWGNEALRRFVVPGSVVGSVAASLFQKMPTIFFDIATAVLLAVIVKKHHGERWAYLAATLYLFHPTLVLLSAGWGQVDSIYTFFLVLAVWFLEQKRLLPAAAALTVSFFFKMQAVALAPLMLYEMTQTKSVRSMLATVGVAFGTAALLNAPFLLAGKFLDVVQVILGVAGSYPRLSMFAFNLWWLASNGQGAVTSDVTPIFGVPAPLLIGFGLYLAVSAYTLWLYHQRRSRVTLWWSASILAAAFFLFPTEIHERYLFPIFALLIPTLPDIPVAKYLYGIFTATFTFGILYVAFVLLRYAPIRPWTILAAAINLTAFAMMMVTLMRQPRTQTS